MSGPSCRVADIDTLPGKACPSATRRWLRRTWRLSRLVLHVAYGAAIVRLLYPFARRDVRLAVRAWWCRSVLRVLGVELHVHGTIPAGCQLVVANHISWLDTFAIGAVLPCWFVSKTEMRAWPLVGWISAANDTVFLRRGSARAVYRMNAEIRRKFDASQSVVIFPEGRTTDGTGVLDFYPALFQPAIDCGKPVLPLAISYRNHADAIATDVAYINDDSLWMSVRAVLDAPRTRVTLAVDELSDCTAMTRRDLAARTCSTIRRLQQPHPTPAERGELAPAETLPLNPLEVVRA
jgi:1-acyl-sn-glycerol-3-phosphate acyltransferase